MIIVPILGGISIFCLTHQRDLFVTNLFGGSMANEGLGTLGFSFDWTMISKFQFKGGLKNYNISLLSHAAAGGNPLWMPFQTIANSLVGYLLSIGFFMGLYYGNV